MDVPVLTSPKYVLLVVAELCQKLICFGRCG